jgi:VanZ family protein
MACQDEFTAACHERVGSVMAAPDKRMSPMKHRCNILRSANDYGGTTMRLALALLGYLTFVMLVITLSPFEFAARQPYVTIGFLAVDVILNVAMFLPIGFLLRSLQQNRTGISWQAVALACLLSALVEFVQFFVPGRFPSPADVAANAAGAWAGVWIRDRVERASFWQRDAVGRIGLDIPVVGLLYLLVPQLALSCVGMLEDRWRVLTSALLLGAGAIVFVDVRRAQHRTGERRFEAETLRRFMPLFGLYLIAAALWPPFREVVPWHGELGMVGRVRDASVIGVLLLLEQMCGFTVFGYAIAEWRGRRELTLAADLPLVTAGALVLAASLETTQGFLAGPGASLLAALLSTAGAAYGAMLYHVARSHVRMMGGPRTRLNSAGASTDR